LIFASRVLQSTESIPGRTRKIGFSDQPLFTMDIANNVWHIAPVPPDVIDHPRPFQKRSLIV
jgi:hypothetical protein